jgi:polygalacturonase
MNKHIDTIIGKSLFVVAMFLFLCSCSQKQEKLPWDFIGEILENIKTPDFPDNTYNILDFGAVANGETPSGKAINEAINQCSKNGGGTVIVPAGTFYTGPIHMQSNVNLHLNERAVLSFSVNPKDYLPLVYTRWEGIDCYNYSPLIYSNGVQNIAITGKGKLQGNAASDNWWPWKGKTEYGWKEGMPSQLDPYARPALKKYNAERVPAEDRRMGEGYYLRPQFINLINSKNILIEDITIENSPFWVIHPVFCENLTVRGIHINSLGPNNDGCNPESSKNVLIENCYFNTGDDCIALKSGRNADGIEAATPSENIIVRDCHMENGHGGVVIGSEISGGARNIFVEDCLMDSPELDRAIRIKTNSKRSGTIEKMYVRNVKIGEVDEAVLRINCMYGIKKEGADTLYPTVREIYLDSIKCSKSEYGLLVEGIENQNCVYDIYINNSEFNGVEKGNSIKEAKEIHFENLFINGKEMTY